MKVNRKLWLQDCLYDETGVHGDIKSLHAVKRCMGDTGAGVYFPGGHTGNDLIFSRNCICDEGDNHGIPFNSGGDIS